MGKGPGQDGKLSASKRSNGQQQADVLEAQRVYVSRFGSRTWRDNQEGGGAGIKDFGSRQLTVQH